MSSTGPLRRRRPRSIRRGLIGGVAVLLLYGTVTLTGIIPPELVRPGSYVAWVVAIVFGYATYRGLL